MRPSALSILLLFILTGLSGAASEPEPAARPNILWILGELAPNRPPEELYDLHADPYEIDNLAASPDHQEILRQMRAVLDRWIDETNDRGRFREDQRVYDYYEQKMKDNYDERIEALRREWGLANSEWRVGNDS